MSVFWKGSSRVPRLDFELGFGCDHRCGHCYNVWNARPGDPQAGYSKGTLCTDAHLAMISKAIEESGAGHATITGGEPLLHKDALLLIERAASMVSSVQLVTNGSHVTDEVARSLARIGVGSTQLTLLSADRDRHDRLKGAICFDDTIRAAVRLSEAGVAVQVCFVATAENWADFEGVLELCFALGVRSLAYNRMSATGWAIHHLDRLMPEVRQVQANLQVADRLAPSYGIRVAIGMPIPPCLIDHRSFPSLSFGSCSVASASPNVTIDPLGNVRSCNLSSHRLGNIREQAWSQIYPGPYVKAFHRELPAMCTDCEHRDTCHGGCKESGFAAYGSLSAPEPFLIRADSLRQGRLRVVQ